MIKACHVTSAHGIEDIRIFHKECVSLAQAGYDVYLVEQGNRYEKQGVHIIGTGEIPQSRIKRMLAGARKAYKRALSLNCDIYHLHDPELLPFGLKLKKKGKIVLFDSHELTRTQIKIKPYLPRVLAKIVSELYAAYENYVLKRIDGVIFPCPVKGQFPLPGKRRVFLNNLPRLTEMYNEYDPQIKKDLNSVCTVGSLTYNRGIKHLILAAYKARCKVILGGVLSPIEFEEEVMAMPESKNVEFLGPLNRDQVKKVYERSQICVSAILNVGQYSGVENLSTKVYESMAMGLPVIMTKQAFNEEMIEKYQFGLCVDPEDLDEFAHAIRILLDNPQLVKHMGVKGREAIRERFNWEMEEKKLIDLYENLITCARV